MNIRGIAHRDQLFEYAKIDGRHVLESEVSRLCLDSILRKHLLNQFEHDLDVEDLDHVLDNLLIYKVFHSPGCIMVGRNTFLFLQVRIKCHFLVI